MMLESSYFEQSPIEEKGSFNSTFSSLSSSLDHLDLTSHTLIHTLSFEILLPHIVIIPLELDIKISIIDV